MEEEIKLEDADLLVVSVLGAEVRRLERELREAAYFLWEHAGRPDGRSLEFWCDAERQCLALRWINTSRLT